MAETARQPLILPRGLVFLAAMWMIGAWFVSLGLRTPVQPSSATYEPGVRMMLLMVALGATIAWPLLRLSQPPMSRPAAQVWLDLAVLLPLMQIVVWLPRVLTVWSVSRAGAIAALLAVWTVLVGALIAVVMDSPRRGPRNLVMMICVAVALLGPTMAWLMAQQGHAAVSHVILGPLLGLRSLTFGGSTQPTPEQWQAIAIVAMAAAAAWVVVALKMLNDRLRNNGSVTK